MEFHVGFLLEILHKCFYRYFFRNSLRNSCRDCYYSQEVLREFRFEILLRFLRIFLGGIFVWIFRIYFQILLWWFSPRISGNISIVSFKISAPRISLNISFRDCFRNSSSTSEIVFGMSQEFFKEFLLTNKWTASETHPWSSVEVPPGSPSVIHLKISPEIPRKVSLENLWVSTEIPPEILFKYPFGNHSEISLHWFVHKLFQDYLQNSSRSYFRHFLRLF